MGITELGNALGMTKGAASKLVKKGMPVTSVDAANAWRAIHAPPRNREKSKVVPRPPAAPRMPQESPVVTTPKDEPNSESEPEPEAPAPSQLPPPETDAEKEDPRQSLKRAKQAERVGFNEIVKCQKNGGSVEDYRKATSLFISSQNNLAKAQREFREWQHAERITLFYEEARDIVGRPHVTAKQTLDIMPKTLAPRLFNQSQKAIEQTLADWVDNLTAMIRAGI
jgi:type IV secretory pathway VirB10-like protein